MIDKRTIPRWQERKHRVSDRKIINALKSGKDISKIEGIQIVRIHGVEYFDLSGISIEGEILDISHLSKVDLSHSRLVDVRFNSRKVLSNFLFYSADLRNVSFQQIGLEELRMENFIFKDAKIDNTDFSNIDFNGRNYFLGSKFYDVDFSKANFEKSIFCDFSKSRFYGCSFSNSNANGCILGGCLFSDTDIRGSSFKNSDLSDIAFQDCIVNSKTAFDKKIILEKNKSFEKAYDVYIQLKHLFRSKGHSNESQKYYLREMVSRGKKEKKKFKKIILLTWVGIAHCFQIPLQISLWMFSAIFLFAFAHLWFGEITLSYGDKPGTIKYFLKCLYLSVITFTTLGYGDIVPTNSVSKVLASIEAILGPILISLFIATIIKKMIQD